MGVGRDPESRGTAEGGCPAAADVELRAIRRRDRAETDPAAIADLLADLPVGVLATAVDGQPLASPNLYVFDPARGAVYLHTARVGRTRRSIEANPRVAFTAFELGRLLPADTALDFSAEYRSVVATGRATVIEDPSEARTALRALLGRYAPHLAPGCDYRDVTSEEMERTSVIRVDLESWSAKAHEAEGPRADAYGWPPPQGEEAP